MWNYLLRIVAAAVSVLAVTSSAGADPVGPSIPSIQVLPAPDQDKPELVFTIHRTLAPGAPAGIPAPTDLTYRIHQAPITVDDVTHSMPPAGRGSRKPKLETNHATPLDYVVVVSKQTQADPEWGQVVRALAFKRHADILVYDGSVTDVRTEMARQMPRYACFVARPEEAGRAFVIAVHRVTRKLNNDPYTDVIWGILTGYSPIDALRIISVDDPLVIRKGAGGTSIPLDLFHEGVWYDEGRKNHMVRKTADGKIEDGRCADDTTSALVDTLNTFQPDLFVTSGHASESNWLIGYSYRNGQFRCKDGVLYGIDTTGHAYPVHSPNPKVYVAVGNCLMGHVKDRQAMALAFMGSGGVDQMIGYVVETWFGYGGWGILDYFQGQAGRFSLAESFFLNNQALIYKLHKEFPDKADVEPSPEEATSVEKIAALLGYSQWNDSVKENVGLVYDRDVVAFYGDPAWDARLDHRSLAWDQKLTRRGNIYTFELTANQDVDPGRPPAALFPRRLRGVRVLKGQEFEPVITGSFLLMPKPAHLEKGKTYRVVFEAAS